MSLDIDSSRALRTHDQLVELIRTILHSTAEDESRSIEWKTGYDNLLGTEASFAIARAILGMANRSVSVSAVNFEGVGYVVVGADPGGLRGQAVPDSAEVLHALRRYTGHGFPLWDARSIDMGGVSVLVITVEPPRDGDRIALLQKAYQPPKGQLVSEGTIFVRQSGATDRASRTEIEMLQDRLLAGRGGHEEALRAEHNRSIRELVADAVSASHRWADAMQILTIMSANGPWRRNDWMEYVDTDTGRQMAVDAQLIKDSARKLRLITSDRELLSAVESAMTEFNNPGAFSGLQRQPVTADARTEAYVHINMVKRGWNDVEQVAVRLLAE